LNEGIQNCLLNDVFENKIERLVFLIDNPDFPIEICILPLAHHFLFQEKVKIKENELESPLGRIIFLLLQTPSDRDFELLRLSLKYLKNINSELVNKLYVEILKIDEHIHLNQFKLLISEALAHLPNNHFENSKLDLLQSDNPEIQFELNIDKIRLLRKSNQHNLASDFIDQNNRLLEEKGISIKREKVTLFFDSLSFFYSDCGEYKKAKGSSLKALSLISEEDLGYGVSLNNLALNCIELKEFDVAEKYLVEALDFDSIRFGKYSENCASRLGNFGYLFLMKDEYEKALVSLQQALQIDEKIFGKYHENVATRLLNISECLRNLNRTDEALNALLKSREIDILNYGMGNPILAASYNIESHIHLKNKNFEQAHSAIDMAIEINKKLNGGINDHLNRDYNFKGILFSKQGDFEKALDNFMNANEIEQILFADHPQHSIITWINICKTTKDLGRLTSENEILNNILKLPVEYTESYKLDIDSLLESFKL